MRKKILLALVLVLLLSLAFFAITLARPQSEFAITWSVLSGGGGPISGGGYSLNSTAGQSAVGSSVGPCHSLGQGFWPYTPGGSACDWISGKVLKIDGSPLAGVVISTGDGLSATTDTGGNYLTGRDSGTYTLTPSFPGFSFTPLSRTVSIPPDKTGQDFIAMILIRLPLVVK
jgi:hypothetical protein